MIQIVHDREAECDIFAAVRYYEGRQEGLGRRLLRALDAAVQRITCAPEAQAYFDKPVRSCRVTSFPYRVLFTFEQETVFIFALAHLSRAPGWWRYRLEP